MEPIYRKTYSITPAIVDLYRRLKPSFLLAFAQEVAGDHFRSFGIDLTTSDQRKLFWAVIRHRVQITRLPLEGETITIETWPLPTTRVAFPRSTVAYDANGNEVFRSISLWVLMDRDSRNMILPGKSGVDVPGLIRGNELTAPGSLGPKALDRHFCHTVVYSELDCNGHVNNTKYLDWMDDLLPSAFHKEHPLKEFTICYLNEAMEGQQLDLNWELQDGPTQRVDAHRGEEKPERVFSAQAVYE